MVKRIEYDTFGNILADSDSLFEIPFGFAGGLHDRDTGLMRFGFRDYDPDTGRWAAKDPIGFAGGDTDLFGYCWNDPVNWVDPNGLEAIIKRNGNNISVIIPLTLKLERGTSIDKVMRIIKTMEKEWSGNIGKYNVTTKIVKGPYLGVNNTLELTSDHRKYSYGDFKTNEFRMQIDSTCNSIKHYAGHLMGHGDKYFDRPGWESQPISPEWKNNIMAAGDNVEERNIDELLKMNR